MAAKCAALRLVNAESKYDQRIIGALVLSLAWWAFWTVYDQKIAIDGPRHLPAVIDAPGILPDRLPDAPPDTAGRTLSYHFEFKPVTPLTAPQPGER